MHYDINVSLNGKHFFATHERSAKTTDDAIKLLQVFTDKFPESEGYKITTTRWELQGHGTNLDQLTIENNQP